MTIDNFKSSQAWKRYVFLLPSVEKERAIKAPDLNRQLSLSLSPSLSFAPLIRDHFVHFSEKAILNLLESHLLNYFTDTLEVYFNWKYWQLFLLKAKWFKEQILKMLFLSIFWAITGLSWIKFHIHNLIRLSAMPKTDWPLCDIMFLPSTLWHLH